MSRTKISFEKYCKAVFSKIVPEKYRGTVDIEVFKDIISINECWNLVNTLPVYLDNKSKTISEFGVYKASMNMADELIRQSEGYNVYGINGKYLDRLKTQITMLKDMWDIVYGQNV